MKGLVAGGVGFVGFHRADALIHAGHDVVIVLSGAKALRSTLLNWASSRKFVMKLKSEERPNVQAICIYPVSIAAKFVANGIGKLRLGWKDACG